MKKLLLILILFLIYPIIVAFNFMIVENALIYWGYDNVLRSIMWVGPDGSIGIRGEIPNERTAIMLMPTMNGSAPFGAKAELVLYRITDGTATHPEENWERFSISAMNDAEPMLRFSGERGGTGQFREFWFGYDTFLPGVAYFPLRVTPNGVFTCTISNVCTKIGG